MDNYTKLGLLVLILFFSSCAKKVTPVKSEESEKYSEDLSVLRPQVDPYVSPVLPQNEPAERSDNVPEADITDELNILLDSIATLNKEISFSQFTIMVYNSNNREGAEEARLRVYRVLPEAKPEMEFIPPFYKVKVGRFFSQVEAYQLFLKLKEQFPNAIIVPEPVYIK